LDKELGMIKMKKYGIKLILLILGIFIGLLLREVPLFVEMRFVNETLLPLLAENQLLTVVIIMAMLGIVLIASKKG